MELVDKMTNHMHLLDPKEKLVTILIKNELVFKGLSVFVLKSLGETHMGHMSEGFEKMILTNDASSSKFKLPFNRAAALHDLSLAFGLKAIFNAQCFECSCDVKVFCETCKVGYCSSICRSKGEQDGHYNHCQASDEDSYDSNLRQFYELKIEEQQHMNKMYEAILKAEKKHVEYAHKEDACWQCCRGARFTCGKCHIAR